MPFFGVLDNTLKVLNEYSIFIFLVLMQGLNEEFNNVEHELEQTVKDKAYQRIMGIALICVLLFQVALNLLIKVITYTRD